MSSIPANMIRVRPARFIRKSPRSAPSFSPTFRPRLQRPSTITSPPARSYSAATDSKAASSTTSARSSLPIRLLRTLGLALVFIPTGFAMATVPIAPAINGYLNPPSDADTLVLFEPYDARSAEIDAHIMNHPIAQALRKNPDMTESRPFMKLPPEAKAHHMTSGALGGAGKLWVPPLVFVHKDGEEGVIFIYLGRDVSGHPGIVHGGMLATLLDEGLARTCFPALPNKVGMTATLTVDYKAPTPADSFVVLRGKTTKVEGRKAWVEGRIEQLDPADGKDPVVYATAKGLFVEPKQAATMARLYPVASG